MGDLPPDQSSSDFDPGFMDLLNRMMEKSVSRDSYLMSLWTNFFNDPVFAQVEREYGLLRDEFNILACVVTYGPLTASHVCMVTGRPRNSVGRGVERLLRRSMISRRIDKTDRRRLILSVRADGQQAYESIAPLFAEREQLMLGALNPRERKALGRILDKLMASHEAWAKEF